ncbi:MAG: AAA family ATPase [Candidatus Ancaeobacter aquaticus]|nr:AAA family ATPase [Candidatus Ancaeobacter aquaticus]
MRFITGPRQSGKTTLSKLKLKREHSQALYYLWDLRSVRDRYKGNQLFFTEDSPPTKNKQWVCFDEIHKIPKWKNALKAIFDSVSDHYKFIVTGSAKLDLFKRAGDSLSGRYFTFHLFPLLLEELVSPKDISHSIPESGIDLILRKIDKKVRTRNELSDLLEYSGFPEPFLKQSRVFYAKWSQEYTNTVITEDIRALTRIIDNEHLYDLYNLLPEMVGSPLSESSLASHLELSNPTIKNYIKRLEDFYLAFKISPYSKNIKRSLLKAPKCYLYNWALIRDPGRRFENYVAVEIMTRLHLWMDMSGDRYSLYYIRNKQKQETDFLILKNNDPWLLIETKYSDGFISPHHYRTQTVLGNIPFLQICREDGVCKMEKKNAYRVSASRFFS